MEREWVCLESRNVCLWEGCMVSVNKPGIGCVCL